MADAGLKPGDIDGIATASETPVTVALISASTPEWVDGTAVGGCSFMIHVHHAPRRSPRAIYACHCTDCQRITSSAFSMVVVASGRGLQTHSR